MLFRSRYYGCSSPKWQCDHYAEQINNSLVFACFS